MEQTAAHGEESMGEHEVSTGETAAASKMDVEVSLVDTAPLADAEETFKSPKSIRSVKSVLSRDSNKSSGEQAVDRPSTPLKVGVVVISFPDAEEADATVSPIEDPETPDEMQIAAPSGGTLRSKDTAGLPSYMTLSQWLALSMARHPRRNLSLSLLLTLLASAIGVLLSPFKIETSNLLTMYMTRGTEMSNRVKQSQTLLSEMSEKRFSDQRQKTNQVKQSETLLTVDDPFEELVCGGDWYGSRYVRRDDIFSCVILHIHLQMFHFSKMVAFDSDGFNLVAMWGIDEDETKQYPHEMQVRRCWMQTLCSKCAARNSMSCRCSKTNSCATNVPMDLEGTRAFSRFRLSAWLVLTSNSAKRELNQHYGKSSTSFFFHRNVCTDGKISNRRRRCISLRP